MGVASHTYTSRHLPSIQHTSTWPLLLSRSVRKQLLLKEKQKQHQQLSLKEKRLPRVRQLQLEKLLLKEENLHLLLLLMKQKKLLQLLKSQLRKLLNEIHDVCISSQLLILLQYLFVSPLTTNKTYTL